MHPISATNSQLHPGSPHQKKLRTICEMSTETPHTLNIPPITSNHSLLNSAPPNTQYSLTLSFNPHHVHHFLLSSDFTSLLGHPRFPGFHFNYFLENALDFLPISPASSLPAHTSHPSSLAGPSLLPASPSTHRGPHRTPGRAPGTTQWLPSSHLFYTW